MSRSVAIGVQRRARRRSRISCTGFAAVFSRFACLPIRRRYLAVQSAYGKFAGESAPHPCFKAVVLTGTIRLRKPGFQGESVSPAAATKRRVFARPSIAVGNILQSGGILVAVFALRTVLFDPLDGDCGHVDALGMGSSLFLLARYRALAGRSGRRHSFPLLHSWWDRESPGLASGTSLDL